LEEDRQLRDEDQGVVEDLEDVRVLVNRESLYQLGINKMRPTLRKTKKSLSRTSY
jgi:hypothetical protein